MKLLGLLDSEAYKWDISAPSARTRVPKPCSEMEASGHRGGILTR